MQRWEEDYAHLRDTPADKRSLFDAIKYVPLDAATATPTCPSAGRGATATTTSTTTASGPASTTRTASTSSATSLHVDAQVHENLRGFVQFNAAYVDDRVGGPRYGDVDDFDLQQAFVDLRTSGDANPYAFVRLGRQELTYGAERYVSPDDWRNVRRTFDGAKLAVSVPNDTFEVFAARPVEVEQDEFNDGDSGSTFAGIYNALALPDRAARCGHEVRVVPLLPQPAGGFVAPPTIGVDADTYTLGARLHARPGAFDFDVEGNYQFGNVRRLALERLVRRGRRRVTRSSTTALTPRLFAGFDAASGSSDPDRPLQPALPPDLQLPRPPLPLRPPQPRRRPRRRRPAPDRSRSRCPSPNTATGARTPTTGCSTSAAASSAPTPAPTPPTSATSSTSPSTGRSTSTGAPTSATPTSSPATSSRRPARRKTWTSSTPPSRSRSDWRASRRRRRRLGAPAGGATTERYGGRTGRR